MSYSFHEAAEAELNQAMDYDNAWRPKLGWEFAQEVYVAIQSILAHPAAGTSLSRHTPLSRSSFPLWRDLSGSRR